MRRTRTFAREDKNHMLDALEPLVHRLHCLITIVDSEGECN